MLGNGLTAEKPSFTDLPRRWLTLAAAFLLLFTRRPDAVLNAQFWAEDGAVWYADAYNRGFSALFIPVAGYYQTVSRLVALVAQLFPLAAAPLIFNLAALSTKVLIVNFILSSRLSGVVPDSRARLLLAFVYLALPHSFETHANLTNAQWHLALLGCLIVLAKPSRRFSWRVFDAAAMVIMSLSGPFCLLLVPIAVLKFWARRESWTLCLLVILLAGGVVQTSALLVSERPAQAPLGASFALLMKIIGGQLFLSSIFGERAYAALLNRSLWNVAAAVIVNAAVLPLIVYAMIKAPLELRLLAIFSVLIFAAALLSPAVTNDFAQWEAMCLARTGVRYWTIPSFCFLTTLIYLASTAERTTVKRAAATLLLLAPVGIVGDWRYNAFEDLKFYRYAAEFEKLPAGAEISIPINPGGSHWQMKLSKK